MGVARSLIPGPLWGQKKGDQTTPTSEILAPLFFFLASFHWEDVRKLKIKKGARREENEYLSDFYDDKAAQAFACQIAFLAARFKQHSTVMAGLDKDSGVVLDRTPQEDVIFAHMLHESGEIDDRDFRTYSSLFETLVTSIGADLPDLMIFLDVNVDELMRRVKLRGRECEKNGGVSRKYLKQLGKQYARFVEEIGTHSTVMSVDWNDFKDTNDLWEAVTKAYDGKVGVKKIVL